MLFDTVPCTVSGLQGEFIHAPRLDNLASCHAGIVALVNQAEQATPTTRVVSLYDNEEVGSMSAEGADSPLLAHTLERIAASFDQNREAYLRALANSLCVSADMAHAVHPNYADRHEPKHMPRLNKGPVLKQNANLRYATNASTASRFQAYCDAAEVPLQTFVNRTDLRCGTTIGPITASRLGIDVVDVGNPMLSMHSIREMAGSQDHDMMISALERHFG